MNNHHSDFISKMIQCMEVGTYLELGVYDGDTLEKVRPFVKRCIGVDISDKRITKVGEFYQMTTDLFFESFSSMVDFIFIDADHSFEQVKKDLNNSLKVLSVNGIICLHDTDPKYKHFIDPGYCGDSYRVNNFLNFRPDLWFVTLPITDCGLTIVKRKNELRSNQIIQEIRP